MSNINIKINNNEYSVNENITILEAARLNNIDIPTLCYLKGLNEIASCRICLVEVVGIKNLVPACVTKIKENMHVLTNTDKVINSRKKTLELIMSTHKKDCANCIRNNNCELQKLVNQYEIKATEDINKELCYDKNESSLIVRDNNKCILCRRCVAVCNKNQFTSVIGPNDRGIKTHIGCAFEKNLNEVPCLYCGQCVINCPTGALTERDDSNKLIEALKNKDLHVVVGTAPSIRVALGEEFGMEIGTNVKGKMVSALRKLGFAKVFDVNFGADLTIIEEATEFIERFYKNKKLPMFTSCSPGWIKFIEHYEPDMIDNLSTCKSPQQMFGATIKSYYAKKNNIDPKNIFVVTIMPCIAKKFEKTREYQSVDEISDIDLVLTTRELARLIKKQNIDFNNLTDEDFDNPFGVGASVIFGASGGVMESALRTVVETINKKPLEKLEFNEVRGIENLKEATYKIEDKTVKVAIVSGIRNAKELLDKIKAKEMYYDFIEVMTCPGGCVNGGGQPIHSAEIKSKINLAQERSKTIYEEDRNLSIRKSHQNPYIRQLYSEYIGDPGCEFAHKLLHTKYAKKNKYM